MYIILCTHKRETYTHTHARAHTRAHHACMNAHIHTIFKFLQELLDTRQDLITRGGGVLPYIGILIGYVPRERPPFSTINFRSGAYNFQNF